MSKTARTDEIDELVSSVRDFVAHKEPRKSRVKQTGDKLLLTDDQRVDESHAADRPAPLDIENTLTSLEAAVTSPADDWDDDYSADGFVAASGALRVYDDAPVTPEIAARIEMIAEKEVRDQTVTAFQPANGWKASDDVTAFTSEQDAPEIEADVPGPGGLAHLDEDGLRAMVAEIVHDELAGELGERITRNVRKLVRKEINRVLTSRELIQD